MPVPKLTCKGEKGKTRPAFSKEEIEQLLALVETWQHKSKLAGLGVAHQRWCGVSAWVDGKTGGLDGNNGGGWACLQKGLFIVLICVSYKTEYLTKPSIKV